MSEKGYISNPSTCTCENGKYVQSIIDDSVITQDDIMEATKTVPIKFISRNTITTNLNEKR